MSEPGADGDLRVGVVGAGGVGLLFAAMLGGAAAADPGGRRVVVASRRADLRRLLTREGIVVEREGRATHLPPGSVVGWDPAEEPPGHCDLVVIASRSQDSAYAVAAAARLAGARGRVLVVQNGLRAWHLTRQSELASVAGATYEMAHVGPTANHVIWTRAGRTEVAPADDRDVVAVVDLLRAASLSVEAHASAADVLWRKLVLTVSNWIAAAVGAPLHAVAASPAAEALFLEVVDELEPVAAADGARVSRSWAEQEFAALRAAPTSVGSAYASLRTGQEPEVVDICRSVAERAAAVGTATPRTGALMRLAALQHRVFLDERGAAVAP